MVEPDSEIVARLIMAYTVAVQEQKHSDQSYWRTFFIERHLKIHRLFLYGSSNKVAEVLRNPAKSDLFYGFDGLNSSSRYYNKKFDAKFCFDGLLRFGEAIGALRLDRSEQYLYSFPKRANVDHGVEQIEEFLGMRLSFPNPFPGEHGVQTKRGIVSYRAPQALYQAWRIKQLVVGIENPRVLEIGGGLGRTAYYARQFGVTDYTIIDLPFTSISQGYFLARVLGDTAVLLNGEEEEDRQNRIKILPPSYFLYGDERYDLIVNVDSLTEMSNYMASAYWEQIEAKTGLFLSINHEGNPLLVKELISDSERETAVERTPCWMRNGYVEEVVRFRDI